MPDPEGLTLYKCDISKISAPQDTHMLESPAQHENFFFFTVDGILYGIESCLWPQHAV